MLVRGPVELARWRLPGSGQPDLAVIDQVATLQLTARRAGCAIQLVNASRELVELLDLVGLGEVVPCADVPCGDGLDVEVVGQPEGGEQPGVEEVVVTDDPVA